MVQIVGSKIVYLIIGLIILVFGILFFSPIFTAIKNYIINSDIGATFGLQDEKAQSEAIKIFNELNAKLEGCAKSTKSDCLCTDSQILFPNGYSLTLNNDNRFNLNIILKTNTEQRLADYTFGAKGCYIVRGALAEDIQREDKLPLKLTFGKKNSFVYKRKTYQVDINLLFYKPQDGSNRICIIDKDVAADLKKKEKQLC